jgi:succinate dehydrogenase/fumarate reductase cytochrome b subunit
LSGFHRFTGFAIFVIFYHSFRQWALLRNSSLFASVEIFSRFSEVFSHDYPELRMAVFATASR